MAIEAKPQDSVLIVEYEEIVAGEDTPVSRQKSFQNVRYAATAQDLYDVANALFGLVDHTVLEVRRDDRHMLVDEAV